MYYINLSFLSWMHFLNSSVSCLFFNEGLASCCRGVCVCVCDLIWECVREKREREERERTGCDLIWECNETLVNPAGLRMPAGRVTHVQTCHIHRFRAEFSFIPDTVRMKTNQKSVWCHQCWIRLKREDSISGSQRKVRL